MKKMFFLLAALLLMLTTAAGQPSKQYITVYAEPDHADWVYSCGQPAQFTLYAVKENVRMPLTEIQYSYGPEKLKAEKSGSVTTDSFIRPSSRYSAHSVRLHHEENASANAPPRVSPSG